MTLNITMVTPWGIWQSSDHRLIDPWSGQIVDDNSMKHITIACHDGTALITYTGIGKVSIGRETLHISDWLRETIRGESRSLDGTLKHIRSEATRLLGPLVDGKFEHVFSIGALLRSSPWLVTILNIEETADGQQKKNTRIFNTWGRKLEKEPLYAIAGYVSAVSDQDRALLEKVLRQRPNNVADFHGLLAGINKRAASSQEKSKYKFVSPDCVTSYMDLDGNVSHVIHRQGLSNQFSAVRIPRVVIYGVDWSEMQQLSHEKVMDLGEENYEESKYEKRAEEILKRSVRRRRN